MQNKNTFLDHKYFDPKKLRLDKTHFLSNLKTPKNHEFCIAILPETQKIATLAKTARFQAWQHSNLNSKTNSKRNQNQMQKLGKRHFEKK